MSNQLVPQPVFSLGDGGHEFDDADLMLFSDIFEDEFLPARKSGLRKDTCDDDNEEEDSDEEGPKKRKTAGVPIALLTKEEQDEKREKNREHAKVSRMRKKFLLDSLQRSVEVAEIENQRLKEAIRKHLTADAEELIARCCKGSSSITAKDLLSDGGAEGAARQLNMPDYSLIKTLQSAMQSFVISDPALPDNPIAYASYGFLELTGYTNDQVLGRNCRFLQGAGTDIVTVRHIREHIDKGVESSSVLLNYRADGSTFWNQVYVCPLKDAHGRVINFLGVQCKVTEEYAKAFLATQEEKK